MTWALTSHKSIEFSIFSFRMLFLSKNSLAPGPNAEKSTEGLLVWDPKKVYDSVIAQIIGWR